MSKLETITIDTPSGSNTMQIGSTNTATINLGVSGDTINVPAGVTIANAGTATGFGGDNTPSFGATTSGTQVINNGSFTKVTLNTESWDTDNAFDNSTNYRFTVPSGEGGKYVFHYGGYLVSMTTNGYFQLQLYKNGSQLRSSGFRSYMSSTATASVTINASHTTELAAGDYIEFYVIQDNSDGGGGQRTLNDSNYKPYLTGFKLVGV